MTKIQEEMKKKGINSLSKLQNFVQKQFNYMVNEGIAVKMKNGNYRLKSENELKAGITDL
jgi:hypothetical protein